MTFADVEKLNEKDLAKKLLELKEELLNLRFQHTINQLDNPKRLTFVKKDIARVKTAIRQRELAAAKN